MRYTDLGTLTEAHMVKFGKDNYDNWRVSLNGALLPNQYKGPTPAHDAAVALGKEHKLKVAQFGGVFRVSPPPKPRPVSVVEEAGAGTDTDKLMAMTIPKLTEALESGDHDRNLEALLEYELTKESPRVGATTAIKARIAESAHTDTD